MRQNAASACRTVHIHSHQQHLKWKRDIPPVLTINSGDTINIDSQDCSNGVITKDSTKDILRGCDLAKFDPAYGPVYVKDAEPGDVLKVEILSIKLSDWGWTAILPGFGLLAEDFLEPVLKIWKIEEGLDYVKFKDGVHIRKRPFLGIMGVAPGVEGEFSTIPPLETGGNMDCRDLGVGTTLYLPIRTKGALFSCGDGHTAQGDGEVCGSAIETSLMASLRLTVCKNQPWVTSPQYQTPPLKQILSASDIEADKGEYATMGIDPDLREATKKAARSLINWLVGTKGFTREDAYILASVAGNLRMTEVVDMPNYAITMSLPLNIFV